MRTMKFIDAADLPDAPASVRAETLRGLAFHTADHAWIVAASDKGPAPEWYVWQRAMPEDPRRPTLGYVRRLRGFRLTSRAQAEAFAGLLDDLPFTGAFAVARRAAADAFADTAAATLLRSLLARLDEPVRAASETIRDTRTRLAVAAVSKVAEWAKAARADVERSEDDLLRDDLPTGDAR